MKKHKKFIELVNCYPYPIPMKEEEDYFLLPAKVMRKKGFECEFVTLRAQGDRTIETKFANDKAALEHFRGFPIRRFDKTLSLLNYIRKEKALLHANLRPFLPTTLSSLLPNTKVIRPFTYYMGSNFAIALGSAVLFRRFDRILAVTPYECGVYRKYLIPEKKITHIPLAIDYKFFSKKAKADGVRKKFGIKQSDKVIVAVANVRKLKRFDVLLKALTIVRKSVPTAKVVIVGTDMLHAQGLPSLKETSAKLGISDSVVVTGFQPAEVLRKIYSISDVFVHPAADEYQGLVSYEASAMGIPLCLSTIGSHTSVYGGHALYHEVNDFKKLAENIVTCINKRESRAEHIKFLKNHMKNWDYPVIAKRLSSFYDELI
ncbi:glycosyltransferase family 4 protein [Candidatus Woesearchaeota archaeon]|nr:glycosyltransferase family 4 protein [Candidatus Woesearchaeota archaeon]